MQVISCKSVFSGFQKVPRSPTPSAGKTPKSDGDTWRRAFRHTRDGGKLPVSLLADVDSLFLTLQGLTVHYKICFPSLPSRSLSSTEFVESNVTSIQQAVPLRLKLDKLTHPLKAQQYHLHRSYSNQFHSSLHDPLLDGSPTSSAHSEDIPSLNLDDMGDQNENSIFYSWVQEQDLEVRTQLGIVLVHGFGGGVFSWRHVMGVLSCQVGCAVAAFDRPGWGLTSRPCRRDWEENVLPNPYELEYQVVFHWSSC